MSYQYRENRIAYTGTNRRVALDPLEFQGVLVTTLDVLDHVTITVFNEDNSVLNGPTNASFSKIAQDTRNLDIYAWNGLIDVGNIAQKIKVVWEIKIQGSHEYFVDYIEVIASPLQGRIISVSSSAYIN